MPRLSSTQFMHALPEAVKAALPPAWQKFRTYTRSWLCQFYYGRPELHYEVWNLFDRRGLLEVGLHFESKNAEENARLLAGFGRHLTEIKAMLGPRWEAEQWDKGWTKVYETVHVTAFSTDLLDDIAPRLARSITVLQPMLEGLERPR